MTFSATPSCSCSTFLSTPVRLVVKKDSSAISVSLVGAVVSAVDRNFLRFS